MFIVLEGIDGAGCGAQRKNLEKTLEVEGYSVKTIKFPYYETPMGELIRKFLKEGMDLSVEMQFLLFAGQMVEEKEKIKDERKKSLVICDHYFLATLCYQGVNGFDYQKGVQFAKDFGIEKPDVTFFLDTPLNVAIDRKNKEEGKEVKDRNEGNHEFIAKVDAFYHEMIANQVFGPIKMIDNTKSIDQVSAGIEKEIKALLTV